MFCIYTYFKYGCKHLKYGCKDPKHLKLLKLLKLGEAQATPWFTLRKTTVPPALPPGGGGGIRNAWRRTDPQRKAPSLRASCITVLIEHAGAMDQPGSAVQQ